MKIEQRLWTKTNGWNEFKKLDSELIKPLVLVFGDRFLLEEERVYSEIKSFYPNGEIVIASTSGEISGTQVLDESIAVSAIEFEKSTFSSNRVNVNDYDNSELAGIALANTINADDLKHVFIVSDGGSVNGTALVNGLQSKLPTNVTITGGLAGDGARFEKTLTGLNENAKPGEVIAIGLYGKDLKVGYASVGGWDSFGPVRKITKSEGNKLMELDGKPALDLYKEYLGEKASGLPGTALLFPLSINQKEYDEPLVRTILTVDEQENTMVFAGDMPEGAEARLMKANFDKLIDGAYNAAQLSQKSINEVNPELAILVSCVGRKLVLDQRIEEEVEEVKEIVGDAAITGFYSYGELAPFAGFSSCSLHNQTMTITLLSEN